MTLKPAVATGLSAVPRWRALVGLGGNLGDVRAHVRHALAAMDAWPGTEVEAVSSLYQTRPVDADGPDYLNAAVALRCALGPQELLRSLLALETAQGRQRPYRHAPRTLDLDLLWYGGTVLDTPTLVLPHPRMMSRAFVLVPLAEVAGGLASAPGEHPVLPEPSVLKRLAEAQGVRPVGPV